MSDALTIQDLGREKVELIKQTVAKGATDLELELFLHACKHTGLDPLMKQIYAIKRWSQADGREVMSFQTGIDGLRLIADRTGKYAGSSDAIFEEKDGKPMLAQVTVLKIIDGEKCAFTASARYEEYVQKNRQMQPTSMWAKMPYLMLAKCAEALALRKAFPMELSGLYTNEEMSHLDCDWKESLQRTPSQIMADIEHRDKGQDGPDETAKAAIPVVPASRDAAPHLPSPPAEIVDPGASQGPSGGLQDDPAEPYRAKLRTCERTPQAVTHAYNAIPEYIRQDCHAEFQAQLKAVSKAKK